MLITLNQNVATEQRPLGCGRGTMRFTESFKVKISTIHASMVLELIRIDYSFLSIIRNTWIYTINGGLICPLSQVRRVQKEPMQKGMS